MSAVVQNLNAESIQPTPSNGPATSLDVLDSLSWLPCKLTVEVPVNHFTVADLLALKEGSIVETSFHHTSDLPLRMNQMLIGWTEFEVVGDRLAVRVTEQI